MLVYEAKEWIEKILYERFGQHFDLLISDSKIELHYDCSNHYIIFDNTLPPFLSLEQFPCSNWDATAENWNPAIERTIPSPGALKLPDPLIEVYQDNYTIHYDILGLIYWMLSRLEEVGSNNLDAHGRFPSTSSHAHKYNYLDRPIVDEWLHILGQVIQKTWPQVKLKIHRFNMKVSHDIDAPSRYGFINAQKLIRAVGGDIIKRHDFKSAAIAPWIYFNTRQKLHHSDPFNTFNWIMDESEKQNLTSAFYFICGRTDQTKDANYEIEHPVMRNLMKYIHQRGHEIGLHPSYNTYQTPELIHKEAQRLKKVCEEEGVKQDVWGGRMHFLRWEQPTTMQGWELANMTYDSTLSYADCSGFRCGTCFEYPAFDPVKNKMLNLRIRPLIAMECTIIAKRYMGLGYTKQALNTFLALKEKCKKVNGTFTLLWHNSHFTHERDKWLYQEILK